MRIDLTVHADAGDRRTWTGDQDQRPLSALGLRQAGALAEALRAEPIDTLFSSPALRARQTLQPLADQLGQPIQVLSELRETHGFAPPPGWDAPIWADISAPLGGAFAAGRGAAALRRIASLLPAGRAVACTHGDIVPALIAYLIGAHGLAPVTPLARRGGWYTIELAEGAVLVTTHPAPAGFPD